MIVHYKGKIFKFIKGGLNFNLTPKIVEIATIIEDVMFSSPWGALREIGLEIKLFIGNFEGYCNFVIKMEFRRRYAQHKCFYMEEETGEAEVKAVLESMVRSLMF